MNKIRGVILTVLMVSVLWGAEAAAQGGSGGQTVCAGIQTYSVDVSPLPGATYTWSLSGGGTILSGQGTNAIEVGWTEPGGPYILSVFTTAAGCAGPPQELSVTVVEALQGPTLAGKIPPGMSVCEGTPVSASFNPGSGGVGCSDEFEYRYDQSGAWMAYTPEAEIATDGHTFVEIRGRRAGCTPTPGCTETEWEVLASWTVNAQLPLIVTIAADSDPVCENTEVTYTAMVQNGGASPAYAWRVKGGAVSGTGVTFTYTPVDGDVITCEVLSDEPCSSPNPATATFIPVVNPLPVTSGIYHD